MSVATLRVEAAVGLRKAASGRARPRRIQCVAQSVQGAPEPLGRRGLLGLTIAAGESLPATRGVLCIARAAAREGGCKGRADAAAPGIPAGLAVVSAPRRAAAADGPAVEQQPSTAAAEGSAPQQQPEATSSKVPLTAAELEQRAAAKLAEVRPPGRPPARPPPVAACAPCLFGCAQREGPPSNSASATSSLSAQTSCPAPPTCLPACLQEEEARRKAKKTTKGRIRELSELRSELAEKVRAGVPCEAAAV
jgi:hypothetical protein